MSEEHRSTTLGMIVFGLIMIAANARGVFPGEIGSAITATASLIAGLIIGRALP